MNPRGHGRCRRALGPWPGTSPTRCPEGQGSAARAISTFGRATDTGPDGLGSSARTTRRARMSLRRA
eukprot:2001017-Alexandrium_andersonii.AAC.1